MFPSISYIFILFFGAYLTQESNEGYDGTNTLTLDECIDAVDFPLLAKACCQPIVEIDAAMYECFKKHVHTEHDTTETEKEVQLWYFTKCVYEKRKYMKSENQLNMERVRIQAHMLYSDEPNKENFMIDMYQFCDEIATMKIDAAGRDPDQTNAMIHKPYTFLHYLCVVDYSKIMCPYYIWKGKDYKDELICSNYVAQCETNFKSIPK